MFPDKTLIVIPPELVKSLHINEDTWIEETEADNGILLIIYDMHEQKKTVTNISSDEGKDQES